MLGNLFNYIYFCFILLFTSSSPCRKDQFAVLYFFYTRQPVGSLMASEAPCCGGELSGNCLLIILKLFTSYFNF